jgi:hypothetical protein
MSFAYYPGYYLSNLHLNNVITDLQDSLSHSDLRSIALNADHSKIRSNDSEQELENEKTDPEHLKKLYNLYKPLNPPFLSTLRFYRDIIDENTERHLEDSKFARNESDVHKYGPPANGIPQTYYDRSLNDKLVGLINKELSLGVSSKKKATGKFDAKPEEEYKPVEYSPVYDEYVYPYLLNGYLYPYTKWLLYRRQVEKMQRRERESRAAGRSAYVKERSTSVPRSVRFKPDDDQSKWSKTMRDQSHDVVRSRDAPRSRDLQRSRDALRSRDSSRAEVEANRAEVEANRDSELGSKVSSSVQLRGSTPAYDYRQRPWEYMRMLRHNEFVRGLSA